MKRAIYQCVKSIVPVKTRTCFEASVDHVKPDLFSTLSALFRLSVQMQKM